MQRPHFRCQCRRETRCCVHVSARGLRNVLSAICIVARVIPAGGHRSNGDEQSDSLFQGMRRGSDREHHQYGFDRRLSICCRSSTPIRMILSLGRQHGPSEIQRSVRVQRLRIVILGALFHHFETARASVYGVTQGRMKTNATAIG